MSEAGIKGNQGPTGSSSGDGDSHDGGQWTMSAVRATLEQLEVEVEPEPAKIRSRIQLTAIFAGLMLSMFATALDQTIVATAIPTITSELNSAAGYVWIGGAYLLANAAAGPIWAKFSDIWGRKPMLLTSVAFFFSSSIVCAAAVDMKMLIIGRCCQGAAAGGMIQILMITISDLFSQRDRSLYFGLLEVVWTVAGGVGPVLGGLLTQRLSWRWAFWINLPICGLTFLLLLLFLDVHNPRTPVLVGLKAVDWFGSLSILAVTLMVLLGLELGGTSFAWKSPQVLCLVIIGALLSGVFIYSEKRLAEYPLMPIGLFQNLSNVGSLAVCFCHGMCYIAGEYYLPLYFQSALQASPLKSGLLVLPVTVAEALAGIGVGLFIHRTGRFLELIHVGVLGTLLGNGLYIQFSENTSAAKIIGFQIIAGIGQGLLFQAPLIAIQAVVSQENTATATSTFGFVRNLATALSVVICGVIFQNSMDLKAGSLSLPPINLAANVTQALTGGQAAANVMIIGEISDAAQRLAVKEAFVWSLRNMWIFTTCTGAMAVFASLLIRKSVLSVVHVETKTGLREKKDPEST